MAHVNSQTPAELINLDLKNGTVETPSRFDVENELAFYSSYHSNKGNKIIHFIFIPQIAWSTLILTAHAPLKGSHAITLFPGMAVQPNLAMIMALIPNIYYFFLEPVGAALFIPVTVILYTTATYLFAHPPDWLPGGESSMAFGWMMFFTAWAAQFAGHAVFEHRAPALMENPAQALLLAPLFVFLEMLFALFDYKPELEKKVKNKAGIRIRDMNRAKKLKQ